eukprot:1179580-Prorocentrum_minimum.AAC.3
MEYTASQRGDGASLSALEGVKGHGPVSQAQLLHSLGITTRLQALMAKAGSEEEAASLLEGYERLVGAGQKTDETGRTVHGMGEIYQAFAITSRDIGVPPAFEAELDAPQDDNEGSGKDAASGRAEPKR